jgi:hypothetical protein
MEHDPRNQTPSAPAHYHADGKVSRRMSRGDQTVAFHRIQVARREPQFRSRRAFLLARAPPCLARKASKVAAASAFVIWPQPSGRSQRRRTVRAFQCGLLDDAFQQRGDPGTQCGKFALDDVPDQVEINAEVFVD